VSRHSESIRAELSEAGVAPAELESATVRVQEALWHVLQDERGRWVLSAHAEAESEYAITGVLNGQIRHFKVDRTFVDDSGVRWIIDYKTGLREGSGREEFPDAEVERYREQLENYARVLAMLDPRPIRIGLYLPMLGAWREWEVASAASA
jgi:ATP-dependent exoDNAse (exonuclease V) beta subunit